MLLSFCASQINLFALKIVTLKLRKSIRVEQLKLRWAVITKQFLLFRDGHCK